MHLPRRFYTNPYSVMIIPAFGLTDARLNSYHCSSHMDCTNLYPFSAPIHHSVLSHHLESKANLTKCIQSGNCSLYKGKYVTHVTVALSLHHRTTSRLIGCNCHHLHSTHVFIVSSRRRWSRTWWCASGPDYLSSMSGSSTMGTTRSSGLSTWGMRDMSSVCSRMGIVWIFHIHSEYRWQCWG